MPRATVARTSLFVACVIDLGVGGVQDALDVLDSRQVDPSDHMHAEGLRTADSSVPIARCIRTSHTYADP